MTKQDFIAKFSRMGRSENFSVAGRSVLYDHLSETGSLTDDVVAICCSYGEYRSLKQAAEDFGTTPEELRRNATVIPILKTGHVIVAG
jgi:hypothetical protein